MRIRIRTRTRRKIKKKDIEQQGSQAGAYLLPWSSSGTFSAYQSRPEFSVAFTFTLLYFYNLV